MGKKKMTLLLPPSSSLHWAVMAALLVQTLLVTNRVTCAADVIGFEDQKSYYGNPSPDPDARPPPSPTVSYTPPSHGSYNPPAHGGSYSPPAHGGGSSYNPPSHGGGSTYSPPSHGGSPSTPTYHGTPPPANCGNPPSRGSGSRHRHRHHHHNPSPGGSGGGGYNRSPPTTPSPTTPSPGGSGGGGYYHSPPTTPTPTTPSPGGSGGYYHSPPTTTPTPTTPTIPTPVVVVSPPTIVTPPVTPTTPTPVVVSPPSIITPPTTPGITIPSPPFSFDPNSPPFTCVFWRNHPTLIWGILGWWGTVGSAFGIPSLPGIGSNMNLLQALSNTRTDGLGELYREGTAALLNSMVDHARFPYSTTQVRDGFLASLGSNKAAMDQARLFKMANEGRTH